MRRDLVYRDEIMDSLVKEYNRKRTNDGLKLAWIEKAVNDVKPALADLPDKNVGELISRQEAIDALAEYGNGRAVYIGVEEAVRRIEQMPSAEPKRGKWIRTGSGSLYDYYRCSECGIRPKWDCMGDNNWRIAFTNFCPNCGAKMEVPE